MSPSRPTRALHNGNIPTLPKSFKCPMCDSMFTRMSHLHRHMRSHTQTKHHKCERCSYEFSRSDVLKRHRLKCDGSPPIRRTKEFDCKPCSVANDACDMQRPTCGRCVVKGRECVFATNESTKNTKGSRAPTASSGLSSSSGSSTDASPESHPGDEVDKKHRLAGTTDRTASVDPSVSIDGADNPAPAAPLANSHDEEGSLVGAFFHQLPRGDVDPTETREQEYQRLFDEEFASYLLAPLFHVTTRNSPDTPEALRYAMRACGSTHAKDRESARKYLLEAMDAMRDVATRDMMEATGNIPLQTCLATAVVMVTKVAQLYDSQDVRDMSKLLHGIMVMMWWQSGLLKHLQTWILPHDVVNIEQTWREWTVYESAKKAYWVAQDVDFCQSIFWGKKPLLRPEEMNIALACTQELWDAETAYDWYALVFSLPFPALDTLGVPWNQMMSLISTPAAELEALQFPDVSRRSMLSPILYITRDIFLAIGERAVEDKTDAWIEARAGPMYEQLQNWWLISTRLHGATLDSRQTVTLAEDTTPFYWLAQVALWALQSETGTLLGKLSNKRLFVIAAWFKHIREFLASESLDTVKLWRSLVEILEGLDEKRAADEYDGLCTFVDCLKLDDLEDHD
ncbi:hypothetical protein CYLTODRAFT_491434 [Cylindrobasidium torrendii FP15055 ss-10]|uniref:C2H2-type domain-containing protein n=1 Tax=Cylindrobasidium torrendii FP15055 ss-10 TaxID=1314674 RepID=A0A0D7B8H4_9AGAR|nr:hypothetical protein CYLTODRAFT_491434 [Cylindrobasidium torrendii FP15055 ss-10]